MEDSGYKYVEIAFPVNQGFYRNMIVPVYKADKIADKHQRREMYTSMYLYNDHVNCYLKNNKLNGRPSIAGYNGKIWSNYVHFDIDSKDPEISLNESRRLADYLIHKMDIDEYGLTFAWSGKKGLHVGIQASVFDLRPSEYLNRMHTQIRRKLPKLAGVKDLGVIDLLPDKTRLWRMTDTQHRSGLYKIPLSVKELYELSITDIKEMAQSPRNRRFHTDASGLLPAREHPPVEKAVELVKNIKIRPKTFRTVMSRTMSKPTNLKKLLCEARYKLLNSRPPEGSRNNSAHMLISGLRVIGYPRNYCYKVLIDWNARNRVGLDENELEHVLDSAFSGDPYDYGCKSLEKYCPYAKDWSDCKHYRIYQFLNYGEEIEKNS
jgi:hypothetical protein